MTIMPITSCGICVEAVSDGPLPNIDFVRDRRESMATGGAASPTFGLGNKEEKPSPEMRAKMRGNRQPEEILVETFTPGDGTWAQFHGVT